MIEHTLDKVHAILHLRPRAALTQDDFAALAKTVDPYIEQTGGLAGLIIEIESFPGWESFGALVAHFRFLRDHHKKIAKVGLVTDSAIGKLAEHLASHFVAADIRHFAAGEFAAASQWIVSGD